MYLESFKEKFWNKIDSEIDNLGEILLDISAISFEV